MTISLWCILAALLAPYILSVLARSGVTKADYVQNPRAFNETLTGWHRRAHLAQLNAFETFPGFAAAVLVAHMTQVPQLQIDIVALAFILFRILHASFYITDKPNLRSLSWQMGMLCIVSLFVLAAIPQQI
ncbi:MAPEG family protein [Acaryochloris marina]|uniref:Transmembrane membrane protein, putative n=1 Tax=Acaryochloris marina (strain MBIC 11017) TaxID=329726 RepID=B0CFH4_ACAM1|nr:MAPEG family protein [Acaryochloris marina]ABW26993.1 transmembrane membrane protein, putative [Acaryochloris marina MBIC11017]BDM81758.1 membrane protein [Acaryochloris marina MBIC10699]